MSFLLKKIIHRRWPLCCLLFFVMACHTKNHSAAFTPAKADSVKEEQKITVALDTIYRDEKMIKNGDLILRTGRDFTSEIMRQLFVKRQNLFALRHCKHRA